MATLEIPPDLEDLCLARGDDVNPHRPLLTGDVIDSVEVPVLGADRQTVVLVAHPCSMRQGPALAPLLHVAPVANYGSEGDIVWKKHFRVMPLGELPGRQRPVALLDQVTLVPSSEINPARRTFCASRVGINLLRQRLVHHLTRVVVETWMFDQEGAGTYEEVDLMEGWIEAALDTGASLGDATDAFHTWVRSGEEGRTYQDQLADPQAVPAVRRAARVEMRQRYGS